MTACVTLSPTASTTKAHPPRDERNGRVPKSIAYRKSRPACNLNSDCGSRPPSREARAPLVVVDRVEGPDDGLRG